MEFEQRNTQVYNETRREWGLSLLGAMALIRMGWLVAVRAIMPTALPNTADCARHQPSLREAYVASRHCVTHHTCLFIIDGSV